MAFHWKYIILEVYMSIMKCDTVYRTKLHHLALHDTTQLQQPATVITLETKAVC